MPDLNKALHIEKSCFKASALLSTTVLKGSLNWRKNIHTSACSGKKQRWTDFFFNLDKVIFYFWIPTVPCSSVVVTMLFFHLWLRSLRSGTMSYTSVPLPDRYSHSIAHKSTSSVLVELVTGVLIFFLGTVTLSQSLLVHHSCHRHMIRKGLLLQASLFPWKELFTTIYTRMYMYVHLHVYIYIYAHSM